MNAVLEYALMLAAKGIPVFPCKPDKRPYTQHGFKDASTDPEQIKAWWAQYPKAMIGMPTGKASGVWVLDIDAAKEGETVDGYASLEDLTAKYGQLPATRKHTTGGGGTHYLFCYPKDGRRIGNSAKRMPPKIDVRGEGGYIIVPPSVNASGGVYTVKDKTSIADTPDWLLDLVSPLPERDKSKNATPEGPYFEKYRKHYREAHIKRIANLSVYAKTAIMREIEALASSIPDMNRNANLNSTAFALGRWVAGGELPEDDALTMLCDVANLIELDVDETAKTLESGLSAGMKEPRNTQRPSGETSTDSTAFAYKVYSCAEILNIPRPQWRVKNVLPGIGLAAIFGPSRAGKSFLALDLAFAITRGADWFQWETVPCPVLYVNLESSWGLQGRLKAWAQDTGHTLPEDLHFIIEPLDLQEGEHVQGIIQAAPGNGVVIIDTLNRATPGADENSSRDMSNIIKAATEIQAATG
ncbi:MAG: bifunctional DNA primase/polymerase, partial [Dehalococcoidia bacterium]|nr:bifunctional DNA primase/polymerase [Dehalococcoidia bacterium]